MGSFPSYGDLVYVDFTPAEASAPGEFEDPHPAVVVQYTRSGDRAVVVAPVSSRDRQSRAREVTLYATLDGLSAESVAILNLLTAVSFEGRIRLGDDETDSWRLGRLPPKKMEEIQSKLARLFKI